MLDTIYSLPYFVLEVPNLRLKKPAWLAMPPPMVVFAFVLVSYFLVTGGKYNYFFIVSLNIVNYLFPYHSNISYQLDLLK